MIDAKLIVKATNAEYSGENIEFTGLTTDSRAVQAGELFVAFSGENFDGHNYCVKAVELGAEGVGLCRTEHMFFEEDRIPKIRKMILSETV